MQRGTGQLTRPISFVVVTPVRLQAVRADDLPKLRMNSLDDDPFGFFGFTATNSLDRNFAADGMISDASGSLVVEDETVR